MTIETRQTDSETGGQKGSKPERYSLLPAEPLAEVARVYAYGAEKYDDNNWRKGYKWSLSYDALQRHINAFWGGQSVDPESGQHHLAHAVFHLFTLMTYDGLNSANEYIREAYEVRDDRYDGEIITIPIVSS